jgi:hypothetical protein
VYTLAKYDFINRFTSGDSRTKANELTAWTDVCFTNDPSVHVSLMCPLRWINMIHKCNCLWWRCYSYEHSSIYTLSLNLRKQKLLHLTGRIFQPYSWIFCWLTPFAEYSPASSATDAQPMKTDISFYCLWSVVTVFAAARHQTLSYNNAHHYKYKQNTVKHNSINDFIKVYILHCFFQHVSFLVMSHLQVDYFS